MIPSDDVIMNIIKYDADESYFQVNNTNEVGKLDQDITRTKTDLYNVMKQGMSECFRWNALILILMYLFENNVSKIDGGLQMV